MIASFPNLGHSWPAFKTLLECFDVKVVLPDLTNREALKIGVKYSPEFVCLPFKSTLGDFVSCIKNGADTLIMAVDCGPCRLGFYSSLHERLLKNMGYKNVRVIPLNQADLLEFKWLNTFFKVSTSNALIKYSMMVKATIFFLKKAKYIEDIQTAEGIFRAYEQNTGDTTRTVNKLLKRLDKTNTVQSLRDFKFVIRNNFKYIDIDKKRVPLRVVRAGEIHVTLEPYVNLEIRRRLGEIGVIIHQSLSLYDWIIHRLHLNFRRKWLEHLANPHIPLDIGGETIWVIGEYINSAMEGFDGFIHNYPFTCMPETTSRTIIEEKLKKKYELPVLFISLDEQSGVEGFRTRLEAFVDLMNSRRNLKLKKGRTEKQVLFANHNNFYRNDFYYKCIKFIQE